VKRGRKQDLLLELYHLLSGLRFVMRQRNALESRVRLCASGRFVDDIQRFVVHRYILDTFDLRFIEVLNNWGYFGAGAGRLPGCRIAGA
jgi:hypothetical protein